MDKCLFFLLFITLQSALGATQLAYQPNTASALVLNPENNTSTNYFETRKTKHFKKQMRSYDPKKRKGWLIVEIVLLSFATALASMLTAAAYAFSATPGVPMMIDGGVIAFGLLALLFLTTLVFCIIQLRKVMKILKKQKETAK